MNGACDPTDLDSHDWQPFGKTLLKCARPGCGVVVTRMLFEPEQARLF
jgi:hypothetical protein